MTEYKFESNNIRDILSHVDLNTLFIFDIDHTLIEPAQIIGSTHWERYLAKKFVSQGLNQHEAMIRAFHHWRAIQHLTDVKIVDESIYEVINFLKDLKINIMGLTARDRTLTNLTLDQLKSVQLDNLFTFLNDPHDFPGHYPCHLANGTVFCGFNKKDVGLRLFLDHLAFVPKKIVYVDDQVSHIDELENLSKSMNINYVGMKYGASGDHKFNPKIAEIQEKHLPKLISDQEALNLLEA